MKNWQTYLYLSHKNGHIKTEKISIKTGIFQGDSTSGLLFILSLLPLSWMLKKSNLGYKITRQNDVISHLLFMDDLKLYASNDNQLMNQIHMVKTFSDDIQMNFGIEKCNKLTICRGKILHTENIILNNGQELKSLELNEK